MAALPAGGIDSRSRRAGFDQTVAIREDRKPACRKSVMLFDFVFVAALSLVSLTSRSRRITV